MAILEFILSTASSVLGNLITTRFGRKPESVSKAEIKQLIDEAVLARERTNNRAVDPVSRPRYSNDDIMRELESLAAQLSYVRVSPDDIQFLEPKKRLFRATTTPENRLKELRKVIAQRRQQLGIPESGAEVGETPVGTSPPLKSVVTSANAADPGPPRGEWIPVETAETSGTSDARRRLMELRARISTRRGE